jgi:alkanesulfonate monooxygenase SsuD/methylene tetrahydromethanopterin reductase-like flavin-dependent oxidoreductase (luciferase family)
MWLAELHGAPQRSVMSVPLAVAGAIAMRTSRIKIGIAVQVLPLCHPLQLAEEAATIDQLSHGRLIFGVGRSGVVRSYVDYGIPYAESRERFAETLEIIRGAWTRPSFSHTGKYYRFADVALVPRPCQQPHPPIRIAASSPDTFAAIGKAGYPIFAAARVGSLSALAPNVRSYHQAYREAGHPGESQVFLRVPVYVAETAEQAVSEPEASVMLFYRNFARRLGDRAGRTGIALAEQRVESAQRLETMSYDEVLRDKIIVGTPGQVADRLHQLREELGLAGILAELNCGQMIPRERVLNSLRLLCEEVKPNF